MKGVNIKVFRAYNFKGLRLALLLLTVAGLAYPIFIYYRHSASGPEDNHKNISHYKQRHRPRHEIRGFSFNSSHDGRKVISIKADRFSIKKKKLGFLSFGLMNEARFDNAIIHIYGRSGQTEKSEVGSQRSEVRKRQKSEVGGRRSGKDRGQSLPAVSLAGSEVSGEDTEVPPEGRRAGRGQKNWSSGELVEWSSGSGFQPRKSVSGVRGPARRTAGRQDLTFKGIFSKNALPSFQVKRISSIVMEPVCVELHDEQSSVTRISAASAVIRLKKRYILFKGNVRVVSGPRVLTTSRLSLFPENAVIKTDQYFILKTPEKELKGDRLTSDIFLRPAA